ncbi:MAG: thiamine pyrophosphate-dependent dehydrogenase E1 component subunit alpha [Acidimicrobiia bacterium]|nr:thiamine pyrophosphate-dependent dehydrogenase E1 component subunit alpha [Acidimicrobiia bacterium]
MLLIRSVEAAIERTHRAAKITGSFHSSLGQESCAAGVSLALRDDDIVTSNHRGHGHAVGKGVSAEAVIAEMFRRTNGSSGGRGGSMHIHNRSVGFYGETAIVGGGLGWASGAAWTRKRHGSDAIAVAYAGDGAFANGIFAEAIRVADFWEAPCLFVCENNGWAHSMPSDGVFGPAGSITNVVSAMNVRSEFVDGRDAVKVYETGCELVEYVRTGKPAFIEVAVHRVKAHSVNDADYRYRPKNEGAEWLREYDPINSLRASIRVEQQHAIESAVSAVVDEALEAASNGALPETSDALRGIYATRGLGWDGRAEIR